MTTSEIENPQSSAHVGARRIAVVAFAFVMLLTLIQRLCFVGVGDPATFRNEDELDMYQSSFSPLLGTPAQRLIWPGGLMRHYVVGHVLVAFAIDGDTAKTPDGLARSVGAQLRSPWTGLIGMRVLGSVLAAIGFGMLTTVSIRAGTPPLFASAMVVVLSTGELILSHATMATPDAMAWGVLVIALSVAWFGSPGPRLALWAGALGGIALGSKLTVLVIIPAVVGIVVSRSSSKWREVVICGLAIIGGALLATPFFLSDPFRVAKTLIGVTKFKDAEVVGWNGAFMNFFAGVAPWVILSGVGAIAVAAARRMWALMAGFALSTLWLFSSAAGSRQVEPRYFVPLATAYAFAAFVLVFPYLSARPIWIRRSVSALAILTAGVLLIHSSRLQSRSDARRIDATTPIQQAVQDLITLKSGRVLVDEDCFDTVLREHVSSASFARTADQLEIRNAGGEGAARLAANHGASPLLLQVFGGLFDEAGVNHVARLRAMAAAPGGDLDVHWFHPDEKHPGARLWPMVGREAYDAFQSGDYAMLVVRGQAPENLGSVTEYRRSDGTIGFSVIRKSRR